MWDFKVFNDPDELNLFIDTLTGIFWVQSYDVLGAPRFRVWFKT